MDLASLSDETLLGKVQALAEAERFCLIDLLVHLGELDSRTVCQRMGYSSVFAYLTRCLGYAECDAMRRIRTARAARKYPSILRMLAAGELHLVSAAMIAPLLTSENHEGLLRKAARRSTREVECLVAELSPASAEPRDRIRVLPSMSAAQQADPASKPSPNAPACVPAPSLELGLPAGAAAPDAAIAAPVVAVDTVRADGRVLFAFAADDQVRSWYEEARDLLRHRFPMGRMEEVVGEALRRLVEAERPSRPGRRKAKAVAEGASDRCRPSPSPGAAVTIDRRHIPKWVKDEVWRRDSGRCAYVGPDGVRCGETAWLEWDHIIPWALGGGSKDSANIRLLCRAHNQAEATRVFGESWCPRRRADP